MTEDQFKELISILKDIRSSIDEIVKNTDRY